MRNKREKNYWAKKTERFPNRSSAKARSGYLRTQEHVSHVTVSTEGDEHLVRYSVAKWHLDDLERTGLRL